jgi:hypothetical protein
VPTLILRPVATVWTRLLSFVLSLTVLLLAVAPVAATSISTDLWVYQQGDTVNVSGDGFAASEDVVLVTRDPYGVETDRGTAQADPYGNISYSFVLTSDVPGIYDVVAAGLTSGLTASTQFDPTNKCIDISFAAFSWKVGAFTLSLTGTYKTTGGCSEPSSISVRVLATDSTNNTTTRPGGALAASTAASINTSAKTWSASLLFASGTPADGLYDIEAAGNLCASNIDYCGVRDDYFGVDNTAPSSTVDPIPNQSPGIGFSVSGTASDATSGLVDDKVHVSLRRTSTPDGEITSSDRSASGGTWGWNLGGQVAGTYCVDSVATDNAGNVQSPVASACFTVSGVNDAPTANAQSVSTNEDTAKTITLSGSDVDGDSLTFKVTSLPANGNLYVGSDTTGHLILAGELPYTLSGSQVTYDPASNYNGSDSFQFKSRDGSLDSVAAAVSITVSAVNDAPVLGAIGNKNVDEETELAFIATATDVDGDALAFSLADGTTGCSLVIHCVVPSGALIASTGAFSWTPTEAQGPGTYRFKVLVTDDGTPVLSDFEEITVIVAEVNLAPELDAIGNKNVDEGSTLAFTATASDPDLPANGLAFSLADGTTGCSLVIHCVVPSGALIASTGAFSWTPTDNGTYRFKVLVTDDGTPVLSDFEEITVTVANLAPTISSLSFGSASIGCGTNNATLSFIFTDPGTADTHTGSVNWGDGSSAQSLGAVTSPGSVPHTYALAGSHTATLTITDDDGGVGTKTATVLTNYDIGAGILQPINYTGTRSLFKYGSTIPVKIQIKDCDGSVATGLAPTIQVFWVSGTTPSGVEEVVSTSAADSGNVMRYSSGGMQYIFNLATRPLSDPTATYRLEITIQTGQVVTAEFGLKK